MQSIMFTSWSGKVSAFEFRVCGYRGCKKSTGQRPEALPFSVPSLDTVGTYCKKRRGWCKSTQSRSLGKPMWPFTCIYGL